MLREREKKFPWRGSGGIHHSAATQGIVCQVESSVCIVAMVGFVSCLAVVNIHAPAPLAAFSSPALWPAPLLKPGGLDPASAVGPGPARPQSRRPPPRASRPSYAARCRHRSQVDPSYACIRTEFVWGAYIRTSPGSADACWPEGLPGEDLARRCWNTETTRRESRRRRILGDHYQRLSRPSRRTPTAKQLHFERPADLFRAHHLR